MNDLHNTAISKHKPNPSFVLGIGNLVRSSNAVFCASKINNSLAKNKSPLYTIIKGQFTEKQHVKTNNIQKK